MSDCPICRPGQTCVHSGGPHPNDVHYYAAVRSSKYDDGWMRRVAGLVSCRGHFAYGYDDGGRLRCSCGTVVGDRDGLKVHVQAVRT